MTTSPPQATPTTAFFVQAALSFGLSFLAVMYAIAHLEGDSWMRAFFWLGMLSVVTSTFTLSKCVRDHQEATSVVSRVDQVRLDRFIAEHDPFVPPVG